MEVKNCPFCGGEATLLEPCRGANEGGYEIHCFNDDCIAMCGNDNKYELVKSWNNRVVSE